MPGWSGYQVISEAGAAERFLCSVVTICKGILRQRNLWCAEGKMGPQFLLWGGWKVAWISEDHGGNLLALDEIAKKVRHPWAEDRMLIRGGVVELISS